MMTRKKICKKEDGCVVCSADTEKRETIVEILSHCKMGGPFAKNESTCMITLCDKCAENILLL